MIIIPARLASTRFPNKVLTEILGLPMVIRTAKAVECVDNVVIATDSDEVIKVAKEYNINAVLTSTSHNSGTDRINEAASKLGLKDTEIIINIQADEPFIEPQIVQSVKTQIEKISKQSDFTMVSCYKKVDITEANSPNLVKVVLDKNNKALYFSRSLIPYDRENIKIPYFAHLGIYGFTYGSLKEFCNFKEAPLENIEKLEQLRALYNGKQIDMIEVKSQSFGIDTKEDLQKALNLFG
ncbi:MAG: 3-deoxy-manno-octulosonate cytidylyltransferase [Campylobacteraceae bacterium]|jgi:3-deoxy-manno-octulosonate cytidylyltransferase (CMP-KDO synthetase)|nr:3-deoxy-manno-octulosonate cytidylyltransferase [Campylobacteraceae bacterium]